MRNDDGDVAEIESRRGDVEDGDDRQGAADSNEVEAATEGDDEPDCVHRRLRVGVDLAPEPREGWISNHAEMICHPSVSSYPEKGKASSRAKA